MSKEKDMNIKSYEKPSDKLDHKLLKELGIGVNKQGKINSTEKDSELDDDYINDLDDIFDLDFDELERVSPERIVTLDRFMSITNSTHKEYLEENLKKEARKRQVDSTTGQVSLGIGKYQFTLDVYKDNLDSWVRFQIIFGGAGSGKSFYIAHKYVRQAIKYGGLTVLVCKQVSDTIRVTTFAEIVSALEDYKILQDCKIDKKTMTIQLPNGSKFLFTGLANTQKLLGIKGVDVCWIDEADEISRDTFNLLKTRLRGKKYFDGVLYVKHFVLSFNPRNITNWIKEEFFDDEFKPNDMRKYNKNPNKPNLEIIKSVYKDNIENLDDEYIDDLEAYKISDPYYYSVYVLAEWGILGDLVFRKLKKEEEDRKFNIKSLLQNNPNLVLYNGLDFGWTAPTSFVAGAIDVDKKIIYIYDEFYIRGLEFEDMYYKINDLKQTKNSLVADSNDPRGVSYLLRKGIKVKRAYKPSNYLVSSTERLGEYTIYIHTKCKNTFTEFSQYSYGKNKDGSTDFTTFVGEHHSIDATRYLLYEAEELVRNGESAVYRANKVNIRQSTLNRMGRRR